MINWFDRIWAVLLSIASIAALYFYNDAEADTAARICMFGLLCLAFGENIWVFARLHIGERLHDLAWIITVWTITFSQYLTAVIESNIGQWLWIAMMFVGTLMYTHALISQPWKGRRKQHE